LRSISDEHCARLHHQWHVYSLMRGYRWNLHGNSDRHRFLSEPYGQRDLHRARFHCQC
jgi:hypothetical protein